MKKRFLSLLFIGVLTSSCIFSITPNFSDISSEKQNYLNKKIEDLSAQLDYFLSDYKIDGDKEKALGCLRDTRNNVLNNVELEHEKKGLREFDERFRNSNFKTEALGLSNSDKVYNITLKLLSPSAVFAVAAVMITRSLERIIDSGAALDLMDRYLSAVRWQFATYVLPFVMYYLPAIGAKFFALVGC